MERFGSGCFAGEKACQIDTDTEHVSSNNVLHVHRQNSMTKQCSGLKARRRTATVTGIAPQRIDNRKKIEY